MKSLKEVNLLANVKSLEQAIKDINQKIEYHKLKSEELAQNFRFKRAAVLIPIFNHKNVPYVLLTQRSDNLKHHKSEVALPGGKEDANDESIVETALRESEEEIGLDRDHVQIVGVLQPYFTYMTKLLLYPVFAIIKDPENLKLKLNEDEVADIFAVPLQLFLSTEMHTKKAVQHFTFDYFNWNRNERHSGDNEIEFLQISKYHRTSKNYIIWALTAFCCIISAILVFDEMPEEGIYEQVKDLNEFYYNMSQLCYNNIVLITKNAKL